MLIPASFIESNPNKIPATDFWLRLLRDEELRNCDNLQKLLAGCEIIAALDGVDLLAAWQFGISATRRIGARPII